MWDALWSLVAGLNGATLLPFVLLWALSVAWCIARSPSYDDVAGVE